MDRNVHKQCLNIEQEDYNHGICHYKQAPAETCQSDTHDRTDCYSSADRPGNRRAYTAAEPVNDYCYEYALVLAENECIGQAISEMALIDSEGDLICILCFLPKTKDNIQETYRIRNHYE